MTRSNKLPSLVYEPVGAVPGGPPPADPTDPGGHRPPSPSDNRGWWLLVFSVVMALVYVAISAMNR